MLDDIYPRLLLEIIPQELKRSSLDIQRTIADHNAGKHTKSVYGQLIKSVYMTQPESNIGIEFGKFLIPSNLCDFSRILITAQNLKSAIDVVDQFFFIHGASYYPLIHIKRGVASIALTFPYKNNIHECQRRFCSEASFSYLINAIRETSTPNFKPKKVMFDYPEPAYVKDYHPLFGENLLFNQPLNLIEFEEQCIYKTLSSSNPTLHQMYLNKCLDEMRSIEKQSTFEHKAVSFLMHNHPESFNSQKLATKLNISVRGLQKKLNKHDSSFSNIANTARRELAKAYLIQEQQNIDYTAEQLGFQTSSGFRRFFKTEFELNPAEYLKNLSRPVEALNLLP
jgi:AraC-like DNA-binding protein